MSRGSAIDKNTSAPQVKELEHMEDIQDTPHLNACLVCAVLVNA
jgi:hypothetical protein